LNRAPWNPQCRHLGGLTLFVMATCLLAACCTTTRRPDAVCPSKKAALNQRQFMEKLHRARTLARSGQPEGALREYLLVFDSSKSSSALAGVRLSFLIREIVDFGQKYRPAIAALRARRDAMQRRALADPAAHEELPDIRAINSRIGESGRTIALYDVAARARLQREPVSCSSPGSA
jgi:hypothetical protein